MTLRVLFFMLIQFHNFGFYSNSYLYICGHYGLIQVNLYSNNTEYIHTYKLDGVIDQIENVRKFP